MNPAATVERAFELAAAALGPNASVLMWPHATLALPIVALPQGAKPAPEAQENAR
jgi:hypothetical protein